MFRSVSQDAHDHGTVMAPTNENRDHADVPAAFGRRRTRAQAKIEISARREQSKRTREALEAMARRRQIGGSAGGSATNKLSTPPRTPRGGSKTPIKVGASFGENLAVEHTPPRADALARRLSAAGNALRTPEKPNGNNNNNANDANANANAVAAMAATRASRLQARGIAQSGSSGGDRGSSGAAPRKRMISFSPERSEHPINEEAERQKRQRNLKATEKLQLRLDGPTPTRTPEKPLLPPSLVRRETPTPTKSLLHTPQQQLRKSPQTTPQQQRHTASPATTTTPGGRGADIAVAPSPTLLKTQQQQEVAVRSDTPDSIASSCTLELPSGGEETEERAPSRASVSAMKDASCKKELDFTVVDTVVADVKMEDAELKQEEQEATHTQEETQPEKTMTASQEEEAAPLSQPSQEETADSEVQHSVGFGTSSESFTSTSTIEDVGLFNCEIDVEFTGGVYGEGTDGKVSAAMVRGQKVALKRAKPHEGYPEEEAKRRSAIELHYLRRVRHVPGFLQCLGLCDGIEHTCIALEVMDCKLSDYLRRYGQHTKAHKSSSSSSKRRCFTLSLDATKAMLKQICQPMSELHDTVNVAHGDLACRNILLRLPPKGYEQKWEPVVKLSDFGRIKTPASEPQIFGEGFSFHKNVDIGAFAREILYRLLVGEIVPTNCTETRTLHKHLQDVVVERIPEPAKEKLGPFYRLFMRCAGWGVRPSFREIADHLDDLEYFETSDNGYFPLKPSGLGTPLASSSLETASFLSPLVDERARNGKVTGGVAPSSGSNNKYETPTTANPRGLPTTAPANTATSITGVRMLPGKSFTDGPKTVNWLKARSVHPGAGGGGAGAAVGQSLAKPLLRPTTSVSTTAATQPTAASTPNNHNSSGGRAALPKKTPPSAGASRRSLQIINQFQHRLKEKKTC